MNVTLDTKPLPDVILRTTDWEVVFQASVSKLENIYAQKPSNANPSDNPADFFYGLALDPAWNFVDSNGNDGYLTPNARGPPSELHTGISNRKGDLENVTFNAKAGASGMGSFGLSGCDFGDVNFIHYNVSDGNLITPRDYFTVLTLFPPLTASAIPATRLTQDLICLMEMLMNMTLQSFKIVFPDLRFLMQADAIGRIKMEMETLITVIMDFSRDVFPEMTYLLIRIVKFILQILPT